MANRISIGSNVCKKILETSIAENCGIATYIRLQDKIKSGNFDAEFQKEWCAFYAVTARSNEWKEDFFAVFKECKKEKKSRLKQFLQN